MRESVDTRPSFLSFRRRGLGTRLSAQVPWLDQERGFALCVCVCVIVSVCCLHVNTLLYVIGNVFIVLCI